MSLETPGNVYTCVQNIMDTAISCNDLLLRSLFYSDVRVEFPFFLIPQHWTRWACTTHTWSATLITGRIRLRFLWLHCSPDQLRDIYLYGYIRLLNLRLYHTLYTTSANSASKLRYRLTTNQDHWRAEILSTSLSRSLCSQLNSLSHLFFFLSFINLTTV